MLASFAFKRYLAPALAFAATAGYSMTALAQATQGACQISVGYGPATIPPAAPSAVPGLTLFSVGILAAALGVLAWHKRPRGGHKAWAVALWASASLLGMQGGDGLIQAVRAAGPYEFSNSSGGIVADSSIPYANPAPLITITNTSGVNVKITSNANAAETGSCTTGANIAPGGSCTTSAVCSAPQPQLLTVVADPTITCDYSLPALDSASWHNPDGSDGGVYIIPPLLGSAPVFSPSGVVPAPTFSYTRGPALILDPATGQPTNYAEASAGTATITSVAPAGYAFDTNVPPSTTKTWNLPYSCPYGWMTVP